MGRKTLVWFCGLLGLMTPAWPCAGDIVTVGGANVRSGADVETYISTSAGGRYICFPGTPQWPLAGSVEDYDAMPVGVVVEAIEAVEYPIGDLEIEILILPVPRNHIPESSAEGRVVFLSPGKVPYPHQHIHYILAHEIGHVVQHLLMPKSRADLWSTYEALRGLDFQGDDASVPHAWRQAEIFAEDFRILFGGELASCGGNIENHEIAGPQDVDGLREFMLSLLGEWEGRLRLSAYPNPFHSEVVFEAFSLGDDRRVLEVTVFDIRGRRLRDLCSHANASAYLVWDGRDRHGNLVAPGVYFVSLGAGDKSSTHKLIKR